MPLWVEWVEKKQTFFFLYFPSTSSSSSSSITPPAHIEQCLHKLFIITRKKHHHLMCHLHPLHLLFSLLIIIIKQLFCIKAISTSTHNFSFFPFFFTPTRSRSVLKNYFCCYCWLPLPWSKHIVQLLTAGTVKYVCL